METPSSRTLPGRQEVDMTRDELIREYKEQSGSWQGLVGVYAVIVGVMALSGYLMVG
ncbi:hypothetical protein [Roseibium album]|uniref:hypothetical protein n=1 Tax=Roseibium album TaxID=311410 RepID=UPI0018CB97A5|nr:hypothetical protein [Labrenzia sp. EL_195]